MWNERVIHTDTHTNTHIYIYIHMIVNLKGWLFLVFRIVFGFCFLKNHFSSNQTFWKMVFLKSRETSFLSNCQFLNKNQKPVFPSFLAENLFYIYALLQIDLRKAFWYYGKNVRHFT